MPTSERRARLADGVTIIALRRRSGGQEQAAQMLGQAIAAHLPAPVEVLTLLETAQARGGALGKVAEMLARRAPTALYVLTPLLSKSLARTTTVVFQGNGFFLIPYLRWRGHRVVAVSDAPPRPRGGLIWLREQAMNPLMRGADAVVRTFDFPTPFPTSPVIPNILPAYPAAALPFQPGPTRRLIYVGRLEAKKGFGRFLKLARSIPELEFHIYGAGPMEAAAHAAQAGLANVRYHGHSRRWLEEPAPGDCLVGCAPFEGCWTAGREALLHGIPLIFTPSTTGGPQAYGRLTDKAVETPTLERAAVLAAIERLDAAIAADTGPVDVLWREQHPDRAAEAFARLCQ